MNDCISRQAAIEIASDKRCGMNFFDPSEKAIYEVLSDVIHDLISLPSAQPERWIPVTERLPECDSKVLCQTMTKKGIPGFVIGYYDFDRWCCGMNSNVIAWMELPAPYED